MSTATPAATRVALLATLAVTGVALTVFLAERSGAALAPGFAAPFLWLFSALFLVRVLGQLLVRLRRPTWLPPTEEWNLSPYRLLLPAQVAILALMAWIDLALSLGRGPPAHPHPRLGEGVLVTIPIVFHFVLAAYLAVFGWFHASY